MRAKIIDGKALSERIKAGIAVEAEKFYSERGRRIGLAVIIVGENPASKIYVRNKAAACEKCGIASFQYNLPENTSESEIISLIEKINADATIDGLLVQLPLPAHINEKNVLSHVAPEKDIDGFHAVNAGNLMLGSDCLAACTPSGIIELIKSTGINVCGKRAVVVGRSNIVGKPVAMLLLQNDATVTVCHSKTANLTDITKEADILVVAIGKKEYITGDMIKEGATVIDVGMNRVDGKLYGDVHFESACEKADYITPVPGGVGPMTVTMLLKNTLKAACREK